MVTKVNMSEPNEPEHDVQKSTLKATKVLLEVISQHVKTHTMDILGTIATDYNINIDELQEKYGSRPFTIDLGKVKKKSIPQGGDNVSTEPKRRGRKKKPREELIETIEYEFNNVKYLVDNNNNVYTHNVEQPVYVGTKLIDGRIKFMTSSPP